MSHNVLIFRSVIPFVVLCQRDISKTNVQTSPNFLFVHVAYVRVSVLVQWVAIRNVLPVLWVTSRRLKNLRWISIEKARRECTQRKSPVSSIVGKVGCLRLPYFSAASKLFASADFAAACYAYWTFFNENFRLNVSVSVFPTPPITFDGMAQNASTWRVNVTGRIRFTRPFGAVVASFVAWTTLLCIEPG